MQIQMDDALQPRKIIQLCVNCGVEVNKGRKYCDYCNTADKRRQMEQENELIKQENLKKGFKYA